MTDIFEAFIYFFIFIFGISVGSFLNVLIDRLPNEQKISGRSICDHCRRQLAWHDLIPIVSYIFLKGKCQYCRKEISIQYPFVEFLTGVSFVFIYWYFGPLINQNLQFINNFHLKIWQLIGYWIIFSSLIVVFFSDMKFHIIPDSIQLSFFIGSLILLPFFSTGNLAYFFSHRVYSALIIASPIFALHFFSSGKAMGFGDVKLSFTIGFLLGTKLGFMALYSAFISGGIVSVILLLLKKKQLKSKIAFGPFLAIGTILALFLGNRFL